MSDSAQPERADRNASAKRFHQKATSIGTSEGSGADKQGGFDAQAGVRQGHREEHRNWREPGKDIRAGQVKFAHWIEHQRQNRAAQDREAGQRIG